MEYTHKTNFPYSRNISGFLVVPLKDYSNTLHVEIVGGPEPFSEALQSSAVSSTPLA